MTPRPPSHVRPPPAAGLAIPALVRHIRPGAVFAVRDQALVFPDDRVKTGKRTLHETRRCIVVQAAPWCGSRTPLTVQVVPCSTSQRGPVAPWDLAVPDGTDGFDATGVVAYTSIVQSVLEADLVRHYGHIDGALLASLRDRLARLFDLIEIEDDELVDADGLEPT